MLLRHRKRVEPLITHPPLGNPENMGEIIQYAVKRYKHLGDVLQRILPKLDEKVLIEVQNLEPTKDNIVRFTGILREQLLAEYPEIPTASRKEFRNQSHQALRGIWEISQELKCPRELHHEIDLPFFPGETQEDLGNFIGTFQTIEEMMHNSQQEINEQYNKTIPTEADMQRRVTI